MQSLRVKLVLHELCYMHKHFFKVIKLNAILGHHAENRESHSENDPYASQKEEIQDSVHCVIWDLCHKKLDKPGEWEHFRVEAQVFKVLRQSRVSFLQQGHEAFLIDTDAEEICEVIKG